VWGIDHGLCFADFKLRTVVWEFGGQQIPPPLVAAVRPIAEQVPLAIAALDDDVVEALHERQSGSSTTPCSRWTPPAPPSVAPGLT
jgi:hypothetical protein